MVAAFSSGTSRRTGATNLAPHWRPICSRSSRPPNSTRVLQPTRRRCHCTARRVRIPATAELWNRRRGKRHRDVGDGAGLPHPHARRTNRVTRPLLPPAPSVVRRPGRLEGRGTRTLPGGECAELRAQRYGICGGRTPLAVTRYSAGSPWRPYPAALAGNLRGRFAGARMACATGARPPGRDGAALAGRHGPARPLFVH